MSARSGELVFVEGTPPSRAVAPETVGNTQGFCGCLDVIGVTSLPWGGRYEYHLLPEFPVTNHSLPQVHPRELVS